MVEKPGKDEFPLVLEKTFGLLKERASKEKLAEFSEDIEILCFEFPDVDKKIFLEISDDGDMTVGTEEPGKVDCTVSMNSDIAHSILTGEKSQTAVYMTGKLKIKGISPLKFQKLYPKLGPLDECYEEAVSEVRGD